MSKQIFGVIYRAIDPENKSYIGKRQGDGSDVGITYLGSGKIVKAKIKAHGKSYFTYRIVCYCYSEQELLEMEKYFINFFNSKIPNGYNISDGGNGGALNGNKSEEEKLKIYKKISDSNKIAQNRPEQKCKLRIASSGENNPMYGKNAFENKTEEWMKECQKRKSEMMSGENNPMYGKNAFENKTEEQMKEIGRKISVSVKDTMSKSEIKIKMSASQKIAQNTSKQKQTHSKTVKLFNHTHWHWDRGIINMDCLFCIEQVMKEHS